MSAFMERAPSEELRALVENLLDDSITEGQSRRLAEMISSDAQARACYLDHCRMHAALAWEHGVLGGWEGIEEGEGKPRSRWALSLGDWSRSQWSIGLAAAILLLAVLTGTILEPVRQRNAWRSGEILGQVERSAGVEFQVLRAGLQLGMGDEVRAGDYELARGLLQLVLHNQVKLLIEAPARFRLVSSEGMRLEEGRLSAFVPPGVHQFTVDTPDAAVVDHGTEFGVEVHPLRGSEVHVFEGEVEVKPSIAPLDPVRLLAHQATRIEKGASDPSGVSVAPDRFVRSFEEPTRSYSQRIRDLEPAAYYRMSISEDGRTLQDRSGNRRDGVIEAGLMKSSPFANGRIGAGLRLEGPAKQAYAWVDDDLQFEADGYHQLTVMGWVRAKSRPRWASIVAHLPTGEAGAFRFFLDKDHGGLKARVLQADGGLAVVQDPQPLPLNRWQHVAFVADGEILRLYRNGKAVAQVPHGELAMVKAGLLSIGARIVQGETVGGSRRGVENWDGRMDELAIFHRALTPEQVQQIYRSADR